MERRMKFAQEGQSLTEEVARHWLQLASSKWNPQEQKKVPDGVPVGREAFERFVEVYLKENNYRTREWGIARLGADQIARWIDLNSTKVVGVDFPNPITEVEKTKSGFIVASVGNKEIVKEAKTVYDDVMVEHSYRNMYDKPEEQSRYCPEHPGVMLARVSDGVYQCPMSGDTYNYDKGHEVKFDCGVCNQTNKGWNETFPQPAFLTTPNPQTHEKEKDLESFGEEKKEELKKEAGLFGPVQVQTRYCPDHPAEQVVRIADKIYQCPIDREIYDFGEGFTTQHGEKNLGGSVAEMTPDMYDYYNSANARVDASVIKGLVKVAVRPRTERKPPVDRSNVKSYLREFQDEVSRLHLDRTVSVEEMRKRLLEIANDPRMDEKSKIIAIEGKPDKNTGELKGGIKDATSKQAMLEHFWYLLMMFEQQGVLNTNRSSSSNVLTKEAANALETRFIFDLSQALSGDREATKSMKLVVQNVVQKGYNLTQAISDAYVVSDTSLPTTQPEAGIDYSLPGNQTDMSGSRYSNNQPKM